MIKHKIFISDIKKEEEWLEKYRKQGYRFTSLKTLTGRYEFEKLEEYIPKVKIDFRTFQKQDEFDNYLSMFEDSGWKHVAGSKCSGVQYFEQISPNATDDIFSDSDSKASRYKRISNLWLNLFVVYFPVLTVFSITGIFDFNKMYNIKELYYTPGLWEKTGVGFWKSFLFETPFALGRGFTGILFLIITLSYAYFGIKALFWYYKERQCKL